MKLQLLIFVLFSLQIQSINLSVFPLLPAKMSEAFTLYESATKTNATGKVWYDSSILSAKFQFMSSTSICQYIFPNSTDCTMLVINQTAYISLPSKNLCCKRATDMPIERDLLDFLSYKGQEAIDSIAYDLWFYSGDGVFPPIRYWTVPGENRTPKRFQLGKDDDYQLLDFWVNTYSVDFDSNAVFTVPANCSKPCLKNELRKDLEK